jgi:hypothetical protein
MFAVGPPMSEMTPVKPGVLSRMVSISRTTEASERFWMMRPSCSVMEQKVQPPKQPRMIVTPVANLSHDNLNNGPSALVVGTSKPLIKVGQQLRLDECTGRLRDRHRFLLAGRQTGSCQAPFPTLDRGKSYI